MFNFVFFWRRGTTKKRVQTHDGLFHADEVFAIATLDIAFKGNIEIIRSRDLTIPDIDYYIDIGGKYDGIKYFDHHSSDFNENHTSRPNNLIIPKSSFGLIWDVFGDEVCVKNRKISHKVKEMLVIPIDAHDNSIKLFKFNELNYANYTVSNIISAYNRVNEDNDVQFIKALEIAKEALLNIIYNIDKKLNDIEGSRKFFEEYKDNHYVIFDKYYDYSLSREPRYSKITHVIFPENEEWRALCLKDKDNKIKYYFPAEWGGLSQIELQKVSNIKDAIFCHKGRWMCASSTKEGIIQMVNACYK